MNAELRSNYFFWVFFFSSHAWKVSKLLVEKQSKPFLLAIEFPLDGKGLHSTNLAFKVNVKVCSVFLNVNEYIKERPTVCLNQVK